MTWLELRAALLARGWRPSLATNGVWDIWRERGGVNEWLSPSFSGWIHHGVGIYRGSFRTADEAARFLGLTTTTEPTTAGGSSK